MYGWNTDICLCLVICIIVVFCLNRNEAKVGTDIEFVQKQFPCIEEIEEVKYYYDVKSNEREIGLSNIEFDGFIKIGENFCCKITQEYDWKGTKKAKKNNTKENTRTEK